MAYVKPELKRFGSLRELTLVGHGAGCDHWFAFGRHGHGPWFDRWDSEASSGWDRS